MDAENQDGNEGEVKASLEPRYTCLKTGAHFSFTNMCERLHKILLSRRESNITSVTAMSTEPG